MPLRLSSGAHENVLLCGVNGAGKTTAAKEFEADGAVRMCPDEWLLSLVSRGATVVDESGMWQRAERDDRRTWTRRHGIAVELHFLDAPVDELVRRVTERNRSLAPGEARIEPGRVQFWSDRLERPDPDELALFDAPSTPGAHRAGPADRSSPGD